MNILNRLTTASCTAALALALIAPLALTPQPVSATADAELALSDRHRQVSRKVAEFMERFHYSRVALDNSLSSAVLDRYLDNLDGQRLYFRASDVSGFNRYRYELDDRLKSGDLEPVFGIFSVYRERYVERLRYALSLLDEEMDFSGDETFRFDRSDLFWPSTAEEQDEIWRQRVKNDALSLVLAEREWDDVVDTLTTRYERMITRLEQLDSDNVFETFMNAFAHTMDPHTTYLSPRNTEEYRIQMSLSYDGIGASLQVEDDLVVIMEIIPGGPAAADGSLKPQDRITGVGQGEDGEIEDVVGWRLDDVVQLIRGPGGTAVRLRVLPAGSPPGSAETTIELVRDKVRLESQAASSEILDVQRDGQTSRVGVIKIPSFYQDYNARSQGSEDYTSTTRDVRRLIGELEDEGVDGIVVDLRGNGGGHLSEATALTGLFVEPGPVVQLRNSRGQTEVLDDPESQPVYDGPLAVLVNRYSASASEIFAAAIQDYGRGVVLGQRTFGKGSVQNLYNLDRFIPGENYGQLTLTIGKYYRVTGGSTQHRGVEPDIELPSPIDATLIGESARETALPWDQIESTRFRTAETMTHDALSLLSHYHEQRLLGDPDFEYLLAEIGEAASQRDRTEVSLNIDARRAERERLELAQLERENARRAALGMQRLDDLEALAEAEAPDVLLEKSAQIVADMSALAALPAEELEVAASALREGNGRPVPLLDAGISHQR